MRGHLWFRIGVRAYYLARGCHFASSGREKKNSVEQEEVEVEPAPLEPIDVASDGASSSDGRPESGARRMWACIRHTVCLPRSTFEDWGARFTFLSGLIRGWRDGSREDVDPQTRQHSSPQARDLYSTRADAGMGDHRNQNYLSSPWG
jgi:hypothetical protein